MAFDVFILFLFVLDPIKQGSVAGRLHPCPGSAHSSSFQLDRLWYEKLGNSNPGIRINSHDIDGNLNLKYINLICFLLL